MLKSRRPGIFFFDWWPVGGVCVGYTSRKLTSGTWKSPPLNSENVFQNFMTVGSTSSFFQVTLWSPKWRSLNPWKGHLTHPNRSLGRTWILIFRGLFFVSTGHCRSRFVSSPPWKPVRWTDLSPKSQHPRVQRAQPLGVLCCLFCRWWCQIFCIFTSTWGRFPFWLDIFC